jgi:hypothetical protein
MSTETNTNSPAIAQAPGDVNLRVTDAPNLRVTIGDDTTPTLVELLNVADSQQLSHSADVQQFPTGEEFAREIDGHQKFIADLQAKLAEQHFDPRTGQVKGPRYEGDARRHLELQLASRKEALNFTTFNLSRAHAAAERRAADRAQAVADGQPDPGATQLAEQARREQLISATASDIGADGKPIGRIKATQLVDDELQRERVATRVRGNR